MTIQVCWKTIDVTDVWPMIFGPLFLLVKPRQWLTAWGTR
jgi:hypothetical protein